MRKSDTGRFESIDGSDRVSFVYGPLSEIADVLSGYAFKSAWFGEGSSKVIRIGDLQGGLIQVEGAKTFDSSKNKVSDQFKIQAGDILMALSGATTGKIAVARDRDTGLYLNQRVAIVRGKNKTNSEYLRHVLVGGLIDDLLLLAGGAAQPNLSPKNLAAFEIPLPPLEEQKRIAAILDKADAIRRKRQQAIELADQFLSSIFLDMFGDPVTNPKGWKKKKILDLSEVKTGGTPSRVDPDNYCGDIPWVKTTEVVGGLIKGTGEMITEKGRGSSNCSLYPPKSIVIAMYGQGKTRGRTGMLSIPCTTNQACAVILPGEKISQDYLWEYLKLSYEQIRGLGRGGNQPNLNLSLVKNFEVFVPPIEMQDSYLEKVTKGQMLIEKQKAQLVQEEKLFRSLAQQAFNGDLTQSKAA